MALPDWLPAEAWAGFVDMRKKLKKPMTDHAAGLIIKKLDGFRADGQDVERILNNSIENSYQGVFEERERRSEPRAGQRAALPQLGKHGQATANNAQDWLEEQAGQPDTLEAKRRFASLLTGLADYYKQDISRAVLGLYWEGLRQFDYSAVEKACWAHTQNPDTGMWMPKVADIVKMVAGRTDDQAKVAWAKVDRAVRSSPGVYSTVAFDDPLIHRVLADMGGWTSLGAKAEDDWPFVAREFETRYRAFRMRGEIPAYPSTMIGLAESQNHAAGQQNTGGVVLIGQRAAAIAVLKAGTDAPMLQLARIDIASLPASPKKPALLQ